MTCFDSARTGFAAAALLIAAAAAVPAAFALDSSVLNRQNRGFYIGAAAGPNFLSDNDSRHLGTDSKAKYDTGFAGLLSLGYALGNGLRLEFEPGYRYNDVGTIGGGADRAGSDRYNQRLSERRADAVRQELIRQGVPANEIVTVGRGESEPAVPTPDGVREPRNRRVEIVMQSPGA